MATTTVVIPCFNEEKRLDTVQLIQLLRARPSIRLVMVNDGSSDGTGTVLEYLRSALPDRVTVLPLEQNVGKAEAVRQGLLRAMDVSDGMDAVGYADADLATPIDELGRLSQLILDGEADVIIGSRVRLLGRAIERRPARHYCGRLFATAASLVLGVAVYDTQCGAKFFRVTPSLASALSRPFLSQWIFDVELLGRLLGQRGQGQDHPLNLIQEEPLFVWRDIPGSKLRARHMMLAVIDLFQIWRAQRSGSF